MSDKNLTIVFCGFPNKEVISYFKEKLSAYKDVIIQNYSLEQLEKEPTLMENAKILIGWNISEEVLKNAKNVELLINPGVGVENIIRKMKNVGISNKITLVNTHGNTYATAQHEVALLFAVTNQIIIHHNTMAGGRWREAEKKYQSMILRKKKIGFLGFGHIHKHAYRFLSGFDVEFLALKRKWKADEKQQYNEITQYEPSQLKEFLEEADILLVALPLTMDTKGLVGIEELRVLGKEGILVHVGRGPVIKEKDLYDALKNKEIRAAGIDVWYNYSLETWEDNKKYPYHYPFHELDNVVLSPHRAASPFFGDPERWNDIIENIVAFKENKPLKNVVNVELGY